MQTRTNFDIPALLAQVPLFNSLGDDELARLARGTRELTAARGEILFHKGDAPSGFYLVLDGQVKLALTSARGNEKVVDVIGSGQTFGEAVMFMDATHVVFAQALVETRLLLISRTVLLGELEKDPQLARKMLAALSMRLHHLIADVEAYSLHSGRQRIIGYLLREHDDTGEAAESNELAVRLPTSKGVVASRLNLTQEHFSRILHEFSDSGLIIVEGRTIRIPDVARLRACD
ncbi:MAG: Crp/Fnr family transcriptional regulator [Propionivibrio sp.]